VQVSESEWNRVEASAGKWRRVEESGVERYLCRTLVIQMWLYCTELDPITVLVA
jgi:DNA-directed RNA polymerase subunit N (RpoN/RPB10)